MSQISRSCVIASISVFEGSAQREHTIILVLLNTYFISISRNYEDLYASGLLDEFTDVITETPSKLKSRQSFSKDTEYTLGL